MEFNVVLVLSFQPFKGLLGVYFYQLGSNQKILEEFSDIIFIFSTPARPFEPGPIFQSLIYLKLKIHQTIFNKYFYYEINIENYRKQIPSNFDIPDKEGRKTAGETSLTPKIMLPHQQEINETFYHHNHNYSSFQPLKKPQNFKKSHKVIIFVLMTTTRQTRKCQHKHSVWTLNTHKKKNQHFSARWLTPLKCLQILELSGLSHKEGKQISCVVSLHRDAAQVPDVYETLKE